MEEKTLFFGSTLIDQSVGKAGTKAGSGVCKGKVTVYSFSPSKDIINTTSEPVWSYNDQRFIFSCVQDFTVGVDRVSYEPLRRMVIAALATGPVVFFYLSESLDELTYRTELNSLFNSITSIIVDTTFPDRHLCIAASKAGTITSLDLKTGMIQSQASCDLGVKLYSVSYNPDDQVVFCGTDKGLKLYDFEIRTAKEILPTDVQESIPDGSKEAKVINSLSFDSKRRLLYSATDNTISVWRIFCKTNTSKFVQFLASFSINPSLTISSTLLLNDNTYLLVGENGGGVAGFDVSQSIKPEENGKELSRDASWKTAVKKGTGDILEWLQTQEVDTSEATSRKDLIRLVAKTAGVTEDEVIDVLMPSSFKEKPLFAWSTTEPNLPEVIAGGKGNIAAKERALYGFSLLSQQQFVVCGGNSGKITLTSLADFIVPAKRKNISLDSPSEIVLVQEDGRQVALRDGSVIIAK